MRASTRRSTLRAQGSRKLVEQRLRRDQVAGVEALGEPLVDRREQRAGFGALALVAQQPRETRCGAQLQGSRALLAGGGEGAVVASGGLVGGTAGCEEQVAIEAMKVGVE